MLEKFRRNLARIIAPKLGRQYHAAKMSRLTAGWGAISSSADTELKGGLQALRDRSRAVVRDSSYAKRAKILVVNNVIGSGIGLQAQVKNSRGEMHERINEQIESAWEEWSEAEYCHMGASLHFADLERMIVGELFEAGEVFIRLHYSAAQYGSVPLRLELIESERIADNFSYAVGGVIAGNAVRLGIEQDPYYKPIAYYIRKRHPSEYGLGEMPGDEIERVPAENIIHIYVKNRWPQSRGEPWLHTAIRKLNDMDGYSEAEIIAARGAANYLATIESPEDDSQHESDNTSTDFALEPGIMARLSPGERLNFVSPNRPNRNMDAFMRLMLREVAAGIGVSYESLSRDYSQSNYSSSRLALLDDKDVWRTTQAFYLRSFRDLLHDTWLQQAVLSRSIPAINIESYMLQPDVFEAVRFKCRGWSWVDPTKEVEAYVRAVRAGFMTVGDVIAVTGGGKDLEDVLEERAAELDDMDALGLVFDTDPTVAEASVPAASAPAVVEDTPTGNAQDTQGGTPARVLDFAKKGG